MATVINPVLANYNTTPQTQTGSGAYGAVPGATATPPSGYEQISGILPQLPTLTNQSAGVTASQLAGTVPTDVIKQIQDQAASWGVASGMPGSGLSQNLGLRNLGLTSLGQQQAGQTNLLSLMSGLGQQQIDPGLLMSLGQNNAMLAGAPNPQDAAHQMMQDYLSYLNPASGSKNTSEIFTAPGATSDIPGMGAFHNQPAF